VKCRETASVGQPNYSSPAAHSKPSEERTEKNKRKGGKKPRGKKNGGGITRGGETKKKEPREGRAEPRGTKRGERNREKEKIQTEKKAGITEKPLEKHRTGGRIEKNFRSSVSSQRNRGGHGERPRAAEEESS